MGSVRIGAFSVCVCVCVCVRVVSRLGYTGYIDVATPTNIIKPKNCSREHLQTPHAVQCLR